MQWSAPLPYIHPELCRHVNRLHRINGPLCPCRLGGHLSCRPAPGNVKRKCLRRLILVAEALVTTSHHHLRVIMLQPHKPRLFRAARARCEASGSRQLRRGSAAPLATALGSQTLVRLLGILHTRFQPRMAQRLLNTWTHPRGSLGMQLEVFRSGRCSGPCI